MFKYSVTQWIYGDEDLEKSLKRLQKYNYNGVELAGEPDLIDVKKTKMLLEQYEIECSSICGIYNENRDLSSSNHRVRANAINYVKKCIDMAKALGAGVVIVVPTAVGKLSSDSKNDWDIAIESVKEVGRYASEQNMVDALTSIADDLVHVHIADNTREAAGLGQTDFAPVMAFLKNINYQGYVSMEFLPPVSNPYDVTDHESESDLLDDYTGQAIGHIKNIVDDI